VTAPSIDFADFLTVEFGQLGRNSALNVIAEIHWTDSKKEG